MNGKPIPSTGAPRGAGKPQVWHLVTNQRNMLFMLASGLVSGPAGFCGKHYEDPLNAIPGWIPLFREPVPAAALAQAVRERGMRPCIATFALRGVEGPIQALSRNGGLRDIELPTTRRRNDFAVLLMAPLPLTLLVDLKFPSEEDLQLFDSAADEVSNVDLSICQRKVDPALFDGDANLPWPPDSARQEAFSGMSLEARDLTPAYGQAIGGAQAMLFQTANRSALGLAAFRAATGVADDADLALLGADPILTDLPDWLNGRWPAPTDDLARIFWGGIRALVQAQTTSEPPQPIDVLLDYLEDELARTEGSLHQFLAELIKDIRDLFALDGSPVAALLERYKDGMSRAVLLFCQHGNCFELLENGTPQMKPADDIAAALLFGTRDGWLRLPRALRGGDLSGWVSDRMANVEQARKEGRLTFKTPSPPVALAGILPPAGADWSKADEDRALAFARRCGWTNCIHTRITVSPDVRADQIRSDGRDLLLPGDVTSCTAIVSKNRFMNRLKQSPINPGVISGFIQELKE